jgi:ABC-2 type transport system ATP-binding protein
VLTCMGLDFYFGKQKRVNSVSFTLDSAQIIGLFGHNGSGKSTLLKMIGGSLPIRIGKMRLFNENAVGKNHYLPSHLRYRLGVLFQGKSSDEKLSASDNLVYAAKLYGLNKSTIKDKVEETLSLANLLNRAHEPLKKLSGGMLRRLELYRTFLHHPKLLLLDEPCAGLDAIESRKFFTFLKNYVLETQASVLLSSHREEELLFCDRVIMMLDGTIIADQGPLKMFSKLKYLRCSLSLARQDLLKDAIFSKFFDLAHDEVQGEIRGKIFSSDLEDFLKNPLLRNGSIKRFSVEKPSFLDVYENLIETTGLNYEQVDASC